MLRSSSIVILTTAFQTMLSQEVFNPASFPKLKSPHVCCQVKIPLLFKEEEFVKCGLNKTHPEVHGTPEHGDMCSIQKCVFKNKGLMRDDSTINYTAMGQFIDAWPEIRVNFKSAIAAVKQRCIERNFPLPGPPQMCEVSKLLLCISSTMFAECPKWDQSDNICILMKQQIMKINYSIQ